MQKRKYDYYKENETDIVWWLDNYDVIGEHVFSFDKKKRFNLFADYPHKLSAREWMIFNSENPFWEEFFSDRNEFYRLEHLEEIYESEKLWNEIKSNYRYLLLSAEQHNWSLHAVGDWETVCWLIFSDRTYLRRIEYTSERREKEFAEKKGKMRQASFDRLVDTLCKPWPDPDICSDACDGTAWEIIQYSPAGAIENSSGELGYIYGQHVLEAIVKLLPANRDYWLPREMIGHKGKQNTEY